MKNIVKCLSILFLLPIFGGCSMGKDNDLDFYNDLYKTEYKEKFLEKAYKSNKALYGYTQNDEQGYNSWFYLYRQDNIDKDLTYLAKDSKWYFGDSFFKDNVCYTNQVDIVRRYVSQYALEATIYGNIKCNTAKSNGGTLTIKVNDEVKKTITIQDKDTVGVYFEVKANLNINDKVDFVLSGEKAEFDFSPVVSFENSQESSLYHLNDYGKQYGDVFPWYSVEEHQLYMWYLWNDVGTEPFPYTIDLSSNLIKMKTYNEENNYNIYNKYIHNYRYNQMFDTRRFIDQQKYKFGIRDNMLYKDSKRNRYVLIAGCYETFAYPYWVSDLAIYVSDDPLCLEWTKPGNVVRHYDGNLPECPSLIEIGDRWYPMVSVSHVTTHQIGGLRYWVGDKGVDCIDMDYSKCEDYWLDGEDLCAARVTPIGDKVYMWGWITALYDAVPIAPWAGFLNLPREVIQRKDGTLGGRMDPGLVKYINYGNMYQTNDIELNNSSISLLDNVTRTFLTMDVDLSNASEFSYTFAQKDTVVKCTLMKENQKVMMKVQTVGDKKHPINSSLEVYQPSKDNKYQIKIVNDRGIIEFFVNDDNALTAKTKMDDSPYRCGVEVVGETLINNVKINKLRPYSDCD